MPVGMAVLLPWRLLAAERDVGTMKSVSSYIMLLLGAMLCCLALGASRKFCKLLTLPVFARRQTSIAEIGFMEAGSPDMRDSTCSSTISLFNLHDSIAKPKVSIQSPCLVIKNMQNADLDEETISWSQFILGRLSPKAHLTLCHDSHVPLRVSARDRQYVSVSASFLKCRRQMC